jgi:malate dehydrogenase (oxaloacetate-decarboxylating)(NADP+)
MSLPAYEILKNRTAFGKDVAGSTKNSEIVTRGRKRRIIFAEGEDKRVLHTTEFLLRTDRAIPILIGDAHIVAKSIQHERLDFKLGTDVEVYPAQDEYVYRDQNIRELLSEHYRWNVASSAMLHRATRGTPIAARLVDAGVADSLICGVTGRYAWHLSQLTRVLSRGPLAALGTLHAIEHKGRQVFLVDGFDKGAATAVSVAETSLAAAEYVSELGFAIKIWLCARGNSSDRAGSSDEIMRNVRLLLPTDSSQISIRGPVRFEDVIASTDTGTHADILVFCSSDGFAVAREVLRLSYEQEPIGPLLLGLHNKAHIASGEITTESLSGLASFAACAPLRNNP